MDHVPTVPSGRSEPCAQGAESMGRQRRSFWTDGLRKEREGDQDRPGQRQARLRPPHTPAAPRAKCLHVAKRLAPTSPHQDWGPLWGLTQAVDSCPLHKVLPFQGSHTQ